MVLYSSLRFFIFYGLVTYSRYGLVRMMLEEPAKPKGEVDDKFGRMTLRSTFEHIAEKRRAADERLLPNKARF